MRILTASGESKVCVPCKFCSGADTYCTNADKVMFYEQGCEVGEQGKLGEFFCNSCRQMYAIRIDYSYL